MDFNQRDRMALRAALEKLSASASALADASADINKLVTHLDPPQTSQPRGKPNADNAGFSDSSTELRKPQASHDPQHQAFPAEPFPQYGSDAIPKGVPTAGHLTGQPPAQPSNRPSANPTLEPRVPHNYKAAPKAVQRPPSLYSSPADRSSPASPAYPRPARPPKPTKPPMSTEEKIMRGVSIGGAAITIAGIILLVSVAIQRGWLGPLGRVAGAYFIAAALFAAAVWVRKRGTRVEAIIALMVTSQIAAIATTAAVTFILEWWPPSIGSLIILLTNVGFLIVGRMWSSTENVTETASGPQAESGVSSSKTLALKRAGSRTEGSAVLLAVSIVTGLIAWLFSTSPHGWWPVVGIVAALIITFGVSTAKTRLVLAVMAVILQVVLVTAWSGMLLAATLVGVVTAVLLVTLTLWDPVSSRGRSGEDIALEEYWRSFETNPVSSWVGVVSPVPIVLAVTAPLIRLDAIWWSLLPAVLIAGMGLHASLSGLNARAGAAESPAGTPAMEATDSTQLYPTTPPLESQRIARLIAVMGIALTAAMLVIIRFNGPQMNSDTQLNGALPVMIYLIVGAVFFLWLRTLPTERNLGVVPWVAWLIGAVAITGVLFRNVVTLSPLWLTDITAVLQAVLIIVFIGATVVARASFYGRPLWLQLLVGATMLYLSATAIVTITTFLGSQIAGTAGMHLGFLVGHAIVSILWMAIAAGLMLSRRLLDESGALWTGVGLAVAGTVKLVFFDLVALSGVPRAIAFLLSGIALLAIAAMRGRRTSEEPELVDAPSTPVSTPGKDSD